MGEEDENPPDSRRAVLRISEDLQRQQQVSVDPPPPSTGRLVLGFAKGIRVLVWARGFQGPTQRWEDFGHGCGERQSGDDANGKP